MVTLAGLDNTDVAGKQAMVETAVLAATVMNTLGDAMPADLRVKVAEMQSEMEVCTKVLRQHMEDSMHTNSDVTPHMSKICAIFSSLVNCLGFFLSSKSSSSTSA